MARVLLLGGLDPSGGAGVTWDATVAAVLGAAPLPVALATTIQGLRGFVRSCPLDPDVVREQVATVLADAPVQAVKLGYLGSPHAAMLVAEMLLPLRDAVAIVVDPVLSATAGGLAHDAELVAAYREHLLPMATIVTPNTPELEALGGGDAAALLELGAEAVLHKGGHGEGADSVDALWTRELGSGESPYRFVRERLDCGPVRGTGCALASAIAAHLACRHGPLEACRKAGDWLHALLARVTPRPSGLPRHLPLGPRR